MKKTPLAGVGDGDRHVTVTAETNQVVLTPPT